MRSGESLNLEGRKFIPPAGKLFRPSNYVRMLRSAGLCAVFGALRSWDVILTKLFMLFFGALRSWDVKLKSTSCCFPYT